MNTVIESLKQGGIIVFPCDTIWGLICAWNENSINRLYAIKNRPKTLPLISLVSSVEMAQSLTLPWNAEQKRCAEISWPGPVTLIFHKHHAVPDFVTASKPSIGIRFPKFEPLNTLLQTMNVPLVSTSINKSGEPFAKTFEDIPDDILKQTDGYVSTHLPGTGKPSHIIDLTTDAPLTIRS